MTNAEYKVSLEKTKLKKLEEMYNRVFGVPAPSKFAKADYVTALFGKFCELREKEGYVEPEDAEKDSKEASAEETTTQPDRTPQANSRRGTIIKLVVENIWDTDTLAKHLNELNPKWPVAKNKGAIAGTLADMRKNKAWVTDIDKKGRITVKLPEKAAPAAEATSTEAPAEDTEAKAATG